MQRAICLFGNATFFFLALLSLVASAKCDVSASLDNWFIYCFSCNNYLHTTNYNSIAFNALWMTMNDINSITATNEEALRSAFSVHWQKAHAHEVRGSCLRVCLYDTISMVGFLSPEEYVSVRERETSLCYWMRWQWLWQRRRQVDKWFCQLEWSMHVSLAEMLLQF